MEINNQSTSRVDECFVIRASNVPQKFFRFHDEAKKYFRKFGKVKLVSFKPKRGDLLVEYSNAEGMLSALQSGGHYQGQDFVISRDYGPIRNKPVAKDSDPDWITDPEVRAELEAMGAFGLPRSYNLRGEAMSVDPIENLPSKSAVVKRKEPLYVQKMSKKVSAKVKPNEEELDLLQTMKQRANTAEEKFRVLDARDKLIRIKLKRQDSRTSAIVGTCPDMCPEKERLMREAQHQVALYEQGDDNQINHNLAVKQYSRSSADQEAPLPQELRPVSVLQMTMGYLLHNIISMVESQEVNFGEWYHFLWDRMRGIRKDITQQELCCKGSVELVEQCARFHIVCSAILVAEDSSVFDQKINTENLTKCLQTLKYMYHDLQLKKQTCQNEAEFRAYVVLLNLNDGNFMWEVQQLQSDIQRSKEIRFALDTYSAIEKQNYVKFFKLVKSTGFLNACILMRYFIQVRISALRILLKSYSPRASQTSLSVDYLTGILAFEHSAATIEFFETYGLYTNSDRTRIILDKPSFSTPEYPFVLDRAYNTVESKSQLSIAEIICGTKLPLKYFQNHSIQNSFDEHGYLEFVYEENIQPKVEEREQKDASVKAPIDIPEHIGKLVQFPVMSQVQAVQKPVVFRSQPKTDNIFGGISNFEMNVPKAPMFLNPFVVQGNQQSNAEIEHKLRGERELEQRKEQEKLREETKRRCEEKQRLLKEQEMLQKRLNEEQKREELRRIVAEQERLEAERQEALKRKLRQEQKHREEVKNLEIANCVKEVLDNVIAAVEIRARNEKLFQIAVRVQQLKVKKTIRKWREHTRKRRKRKTINFDPFWASNTCLQDDFDNLSVGDFSNALYNIKRFRKIPKFDLDIANRAVTKIDLEQLTYDLIVQRHFEFNSMTSRELFWNVTISLPEASEYKYGLNHIETVLEKCINWKSVGRASVAIVQTKSCPTLTYCIEKQKGLYCNTQGTSNGYIFVANEFTEALYKRVKTNFKHLGLMRKVPVVFALQHYNENNPNLKLLLEEGQVSEHLVIVDKFNTGNLVNMLEKAFVFLGSRIEKPPPLEMDTLKAFLMNHLCHDLWKRANSFSKWNSNYKKCLKDPNTVIYLHNEAVDRIKKILLNQEYSGYQKFPAICKEFLRSGIPETLPCDYKYFPSFWDTPAYIKCLEDTLNTLYLPKFLNDWPPLQQSELEIQIYKYCEEVYKDPHKCFYKSMSLFLRQILPDVNFHDIVHVNWSDVLELFVAEKLEETDFSLYGTGFVKTSTFNQLITVYDYNLLKDYLKCDWFYVNNPVVRHRIMELLNEGNKDVDVDVVVDENYADIDLLFNNLDYYSRKNVVKYTRDLDECKGLMMDLDESLVINKQIFTTSARLLQEIIEDN